MKKKKGFTLLELMVTLSILLILSVMISAILIQSQRILVGVDNKSKIQDEVRTALLKIQTNAQKADEIIVSDKYAVINSNKWELCDNNTSARELLRIISDDEEDTLKVYAEVNYNDNHQLIEFDINKSTHEIMSNSKNVLISKIDENNVDTIDVKLEDVIDSNKKKINELVTINCSKIIKGNKINENDYLISFNNKGKNEINIEIEGSSGNNNGNNSGDNTNLGGSGSFDENNNSGIGGESQNLLKVELELTGKWPGGGQWKLNLTNNTEQNINGCSISFYSNNVITPWPGHASIDIAEDGLVTLYKNKNEWNSEIKSGETIDIQGNYEGNEDLKIDIIDIKYTH